MPYNIIGEGTRRISVLEKELSKAVAMQRAIEYMQLCDELGRDPEFPELYARGLAEFSFEEKQMQELEEENERRSANLETRVPAAEISKQQKYQKFYREGSNLNARDYQQDSEQKKELLTKYFPKFRDTGKEPIKKMRDSQIGYLFQQMMAQAEKKK